MRAAKVDENHREIVKLLKQLGWRVKSTAALPEWLDLIVQDSGGTYLLEVKRHTRSKLTPAQALLQQEGWTFHRINSTEEAYQWSRQYRRSTLALALTWE